MITGVQLVKIIEEFTKKKKISRKDFCESLEIPYQTLASWKTKNILPSLESLNKIAEYMNVSLGWLVCAPDIESELEKDDFLYQEYKQNREQFQEYLKVRDSLKNIFS